MGQKTEEQIQIPELDLNQFNVLYPVGRGAKGVVFRAQIQNPPQDVALKVVLKSSIRNRGDKNIFDDHGFRFEQHVLSELNHPLFPTLKAVFETDQIVGYAIDYCPGGDLNILRKQQVEKMFSDDIIRFYGAELVLALEYLHKKGIVYRDLKPENVMIQENGHLMLVDFDLSTKLVPKSPKTRSSYDSVNKPKPIKKKTHLRKFWFLCESGNSVDDSENSAEESYVSGVTESDSETGKSNSFVGTEDYVAPEIIKGEGHDFAVDWWCLGVVLYELLYGTTPFRGSNRKETFYRILRKSPDLVGETTLLRDLIRKLLEKDPKERISVEEIKGHDFFKGVDWDTILRLPRPPYIPVWPEDNNTDEICVESIVFGIFNKDEVVKKNSGQIDNQIVNKDPWVEGLNKPSMSNDFLVF